MARGPNNENVPIFGTLELGSKTWGQINPAGTCEPNTFPYGEGPDDVTTPRSGPLSSTRPAEELQYYDPDDALAVLESSGRLSRYTDRVLNMIVEHLCSEV